MEDQEVKEVALIDSMLKEAAKAGLLAEVVHTALYSMRGDDTITPSQAIAEGLYEWDI